MSGKRLDVIIVGGSLTGLMHGIVAKRAGHNVTIIEQYISSQREGQAAGIVTLEFFHKYLMAYDKLQSQPYAVLCQGVQHLDRHLTVQLQLKRPMKMSSWNVLYHRLRANFDGLRSMYCEKPPDEEPVYGKATYNDGLKVIGIDYAGQRVKVTFQDLRRPKAIDQMVEADLVIAADGSTSSLRRFTQPEIDFSYAGYVAWRGTVLERDVSESTRGRIDLMTTLCASDQTYIAICTIPGKNGTLKPGERLINYVWYTNLDKSDLPRVMTDSSGRQHRQTLPIGKMRDEVWAQQKEVAAKLLPKAIAELINKTTEPFVSAIMDIPVCGPVSFEGKLLFVGDSLCTFRPHVASSTNQAAYDALLFAKLLKNEINLSTWSAHVVDFSHLTRLRSITWGNWYQYNYFWFVVSKGRLLLAEGFSRLGTMMFGSVVI